MKFYDAVASLNGSKIQISYESSDGPEVHIGRAFGIQPQWYDGKLCPSLLVVQEDDKYIHLEIDKILSIEQL